VLKCDSFKRFVTMTDLRCGNIAQPTGTITTRLSNNTITADWLTLPY